MNTIEHIQYLRDLYNIDKEPLRSERASYKRMAKRAIDALSLLHKALPECTYNAELAEEIYSASGVPAAIQLKISRNAEMYYCQYFADTGRHPKNVDKLPDFEWETV